MVCANWRGNEVAYITVFTVTWQLAECVPQPCSHIFNKMVLLYIFLLQYTESTTVQSPVPVAARSKA